MSGRVFSISFAGVAVTVAQDLFEITLADDEIIEPVAIELGQTSDVGDAAAENLQLTFIRGHTTGGSVGSAATPVPLDGGAAPGFTAEVNNTTVASAGTAERLAATAWNIQAGYMNYLPDDLRARVKQGHGTLVVRMSAPADAITLSGTLWVKVL